MYSTSLSSSRLLAPSIACPRICNSLYAKGPVVSDVGAGSLCVDARAFGGLVLEFGNGGDDRHRLRLWVLRRGEIEISLGKDFHRIGSERQHREVFRIMELIVGSEREQSE